ncbi:unnamed protein product [Prorocentrum cordatum]|uniref:Uncharacterized protein n=1 Tax=Prorocentrum cordatum TaxID=2364126 RepID=A0ABN9W325_9DINO|nr:unnamed protein product [Polarella glacialis]
MLRALVRGEGPAHRDRVFGRAEEQPVIGWALPRFYITGCVTWFQTRGVPCDQPLQWWLLVALVTPILHKQTCQHDGTSSSFHKIVLAMELVYVVMGTWLLFSCSTCSDTNSRLYNFVAYYLAYKVLARSLLCFTSCGMMTLMFFIARRGLLDSSHGGMAARPGFVEENRDS